jgi:FMN phosphatase YigB (HAD superfamily)
MFNLKPEECLFIDDKQENISGAKRMGITGILFTNATETKRKIKELL